MVNVRKFCGWLMLSGLVVCSAGAQSVLTKKDMQARLVGPFVLLRGMYDGEQLDFDAHGDLVGHARTVPLSLGAVIVDRVRMKDAEIEIEAKRAGLEFSQKGDGPSQAIQPERIKGREKLKITIARDAQHPEWLQEALGKVFAVGFDEGFAQDAPNYWKPWLHYYLHPDDPSNDTLFKRRPDENPFKGPGLKAPRLISTVDPVFTDEARAIRYEAQVVLSLIVDSDGDPLRVVIVRPAGMGLDEMAVQAVQQYKFAPATRDGTPYDADIKVRVNFRIR